ncbi:MAG: malto-oligosyltrehalose synthase, partial [Bryobacteraceae bacterium]
SWLSRNEHFETATREFIERIYEDSAFRNDFEAFVQPLIEPGRVNSLSQLLLKLTSPGIPDMYQGSEIWDLSLVDPDNRRPVDFDLRRRLFSELAHLKVEEVRQRTDEGLPKLWVTHHTLGARRQRPEAFGDGGTYTPLAAKGPKAAHLIAYMRGNGVLVAAPRLVLTLNGDWGGTSLELPQGKWRNQFSDAVLEGGNIDAGELLSSFPVALLMKE